jgi:putative membrane protein
MNWIKNQTLTNRLILAVSLLIPVVVSALRYIPHPVFDDATRQALYTLPMINATLNGTAFIVLLAALIAIKSKNIALHKRLTSIALTLSVLFLVSYVVFHYTTPSTPFGGQGSVRTLYFIILISHVLLSAAIVPLALLAYAHGFSGRYAQHKRLVRFTYPLWLYVTLTGVIVYLMIRPYYPL